MASKKRKPKKPRAVRAWALVNKRGKLVQNGAFEVYTTRKAAEWLASGFTYGPLALTLAEIAGLANDETDD